MRNQRAVEIQRQLDDAGRLSEAGHSDRAEELLRGLLAENPREARAVSALGIIAARTGRPDLAIHRLREAAEIDPHNASTLCWLSYFLAHEGQLAEATTIAEKAVSVDPRDPTTHATLAQCLARQGKAAEAIPSFETSLLLDPNNAAILNELSDALLACRRWLAATLTLRKAVLMAPEPKQLLQLTYLELRLGNIESAERYGRRFLRKQPDSPDGNILMARILTEQLKTEESEAYWKRAEALGADLGSIHLDKALSLCAIGQFDEAVSRLERSIQVKPVQGEAYQALAYSKRVTRQDMDLVAQMERNLSDESLSAAEHLNLLYGLGKCYDNLGDYERAITAFDRANALKIQTEGYRPFDRDAFRSMVESKMALFTSKFFADWKHFRSDSRLPILVAGMMRSGTTLVEQMLTCHPNIGGAGELSYWAENELSIVDTNRHSVSPPELRAHAREYANLLVSTAPGFSLVIDKNPANLQYLGSFHLAFPNAKIILTRRNAIDTALSIWMTPVNTMAEFVCDRGSIVYAYKQCMRLMDHWLKAIPSDRIMEIQYEALVSDPKFHAPKIVAFCGAEWNEACLHPELNDRRVRTPSMWQVRQPIYKSSTERWKKYEPWLKEFSELAE